MNEPLKVVCDCGTVEAHLHGVTPKVANRVVCCCSSCQRYARLLEHGHLLTPDGGSELFQVSPKHLTVHRGEASIACLTMTSKGPLRWFAECCNTPLANTFPTRGVPFMGVSVAATNFAGADPSSFIGPLRATVNGHIEPSDRKALGATRWALVKMLGRLAPKMLMWRLRGDHKRSPWFDAAGLPISPPKRPSDVASKLTTEQPTGD